MKEMQVSGKKEKKVLQNVKRLWHRQQMVTKERERTLADEPVCPFQIGRDHVVVDELHTLRSNRRDLFPIPDMR
ncbi:histone-lysine N-methyltransferase SUVR2-like [Dorcoceras hygrometricum]|uniref:Histone-lysine N-methyltransferase SUVR2-like n=1 Tax=Dorcoceras hygrometricum TaxID=472368 RepID=A0A2Z7BFM4_9LAMI|nr:histone-lysine N-methyltransferase SUVR2-like [Dorcoceras hygrometricum]